MIVRVKLRELYNTRYLYVTLQRDLIYLFSTYLELRKNSDYEYFAGNDLLQKVYSAARVGTNVEFDLADTKITPDIEQTIRTYGFKGIAFVDTKDYYRNEILKENRRRAQIDTSSFVPLPEYNSTQLVKDYVQSLKKDVTYTVTYNNVEVYLPLLYIIMVTRPSIKIDLAGMCSEFFSFVGKRLTLSDLEGYSEFYFSDREGTVVVSLNDGKVYTQRMGLCDLETASTLGSLVPTVLGSKRLLNEGCWHTIFRTCLGMLNGYRATRKKKLYEVLGVEKE